MGSTPKWGPIRLKIFGSPDLSVFLINLLSDRDSVYSRENVLEILRIPVKTCLICTGTNVKTCWKLWQSYLFEVQSPPSAVTLGATCMKEISRFLIEMGPSRKSRNLPNSHRNGLWLWEPFFDGSISMRNREISRFPIAALAPTDTETHIDNVPTTQEQTSVCAVCTCVCVCVCVTHTHTHTRTRPYSHRYVCVCVCVCVSMHVCVCLCVCLCVCVWCVCVCLCVCVCMCVCVFI